VLLAESAGGHLSFLLTRYLSESALPIPRTMILSSPWVDFTFFFPSYTTHKPFDSLHVGRLSRAVRSAMRYYTPQAVRGVYFSPALGKPEDWAYLVKEEVRVYMQVGTRERFEDEIRKVGRDMKDAGVDVILREVSGANLMEGGTMPLIRTSGWQEQGASSKEQGARSRSRADDPVRTWTGYIPAL
jgi:acetyl esterase/lipase